MTVRVEPFAHETLERYAEAGYATRSLLRRAIAYYLSEAGSGRSAWLVPQFVEDRPAKGVRLRIHLDDGTWRALVDAGAAQGVSLETLARHALLFFLADLDAGRVAAGVERGQAEEGRDRD